MIKSRSKFFLIIPLLSKDIKTDTDLGVSNHTCSPNVYVEPHEERCEWYYLCGEGSQTHLYQCADDLLYEIKMNGCNLNWLVDCGTRTRPFTCPSPNGNFPISPNACDSKYYSCVDNIYTSQVGNRLFIYTCQYFSSIDFLQTCPNGEIFNPSTRTCSSTYVCPSESFLISNSSYSFL